MLRRINIPPGVNRDSTSFEASGQWYDCNNVRFRGGIPESIGGWESLKNPPESTTEYELEGFGRACFSSKSYTGYKYRWVGTNRKFYIATDENGPVDVTPNSKVLTLGSDPFDPTSGSSVVTVADSSSSHAFAVGDYVTFKGAATTGGIPDTTLNRAAGFIIQTVSAGASFTIDVETAATSGTAGGGVSVVACYKIPSGSNTVVTGAGWGIGEWGGEGTPTEYDLSTTDENVYIQSSTYGLFDRTGAAKPDPDVVAGDKIYAKLPAVSVTITGIDKDPEATVTAANTFSNGDDVIIYGVSGMTEVNGNTYEVSDRSDNDFKIKVPGGAYINSSSFTTYGSGGVASEVLLSIYLSELNNNWWTITSVSGTSDKNLNFALPYRASVVGAISGGGKSGTYYRANAAGVVDGATRGWGTPSAGVVATVESTRRVYIDNYGEDLMYANSGGPIYYYDLSENISSGVPIVDPEDNVAIVMSDDTAFDGNIGTPSVVDSFLVSKRDGHCVALGCNDIGGSTMNTLLVRWSDQNNPFDWTPSPVNTSGGQVLRVGSKILGGISTKDEVVIFTDSGVYAMKFQGPPHVFSFSLITEGVEITSALSAVSAANAVYFMANDSFYSYNGGSVDPLKCPVSKYIFDDFNYDQRDKSYGAQNSSFGEVYWFYPSLMSNEVDRYVIYSYETGAWSYGVFDMSSFSRDVSSTTDYSRTAWRDSAVYNSPWSSYIRNHIRGVGNLPDLQKSGLMIHETGTSANSAALDSYVESGDISLSSEGSEGDRFMFYKRIVPDLQIFDVPNTASTTQTMQIVITGKNFPGSSSTTGVVTKDMDFDISGGLVGTGYPYEPTDGNTAIRGRGRSISMKLMASATEFSWRAGDTRLEMQPDGRR